MTITVCWRAQGQLGRVESAICEVNRGAVIVDVIIVLRRQGQRGWRWQQSAHYLCTWLKVYNKDADLFCAKPFSVQDCK